VGKGRHLKKETVVLLQFSGALNPAAAQNLAAYSLLAGTIKKHILSFKKPIPFVSAIYNPTALTVSLVPKGTRKLPKYEQLTISSALLTDSFGRPIDNGHKVVATVSRSGLIIAAVGGSSAAAIGAPKAAAVDALFEQGLALHCRILGVEIDQHVAQAHHPRPARPPAGRPRGEGAPGGAARAVFQHRRRDPRPGLPGQLAHR